MSSQLPKDFDPLGIGSTGNLDSLYDISEVDQLSNQGFPIPENIIYDPDEYVGPKLGSAPSLDGEGSMDIRNLAAMPSYFNIEVHPEVPDLTNFEWLHPHQKNEVEIKHPSDTMKEELYLSWKRNRPGNVELSSLNQDKPTEKKAEKFDWKKANKALRLAYQKAHFGEKWDSIEQNLRALIPQHNSKFEKKIAALKDEYGLLGNVYIKAECFPNIQSPEIARKIRRKCAKAEYLITNHEISNFPHLIQVNSLHWESIIDRYQKKAYITTKVASKEDLRRFFLNPPKKKIREEVKPEGVYLSTLRRQIMASPKKENKEQIKALQTIARWTQNGLITKKQAAKAVDLNTKPQQWIERAARYFNETLESVYEVQGIQPQREVVDPEEAMRALRNAKAPDIKIRKKSSYQAIEANARKTLDRWASAKLITQDERDQILSYRVHPKEWIRAASKCILSRQNLSHYEGAGLDVKTPENGTWGIEKTIEGHVPTAEETFMKGQEAQLQKFAKTLIQKKVASKAQVEEIVNSSKSIQDRKAMLSDLLRVKVKEREYQGQKAEAMVSQPKRVKLSKEQIKLQKRARDHGVAVGEIEAVVRWVDKTLSKPCLKAAFVSEFSRKFNTKLRIAAKPYIEEKVMNFPYIQPQPKQEAPAFTLDEFDMGGEYNFKLAQENAEVAPQMEVEFGDLISVNGGQR